MNLRRPNIIESTIELNWEKNVSNRTVTCTATAKSFCVNADAECVFEDIPPYTVNLPNYNDEPMPEYVTNAVERSAVQLMCEQYHAKVVEQLMKEANENTVAEPADNEE